MPRKSWWARLPFGVRMTAGASALLLAIAGVLAGLAALTKDGPDAPRIVTAVGDTTPKADAGSEPPPYAVVPPGSVTRTPDRAGPTATREPRPPAPTKAPTRPPAGTTAGTAAKATAGTPAGTTAAAGTGAGAGVDRARAADPRPVRVKPQASRKPTVAAPAKPARKAKPASHAKARPTITTRIDYEKRDIAFQTRYVRDPMLPQGFRRVQVEGASGQEKLRYLVTLTNGHETGRKLVSRTVTREPRNRVILLGTRSDFDGPFDDDDSRGDCGLDFDLCGPFGRLAIGFCPDGPAEPVIRMLGLRMRDELPELDCADQEELSRLRQ